MKRLDLKKKYQISICSNKVLHSSVVQQFIKFGIIGLSNTLLSYVLYLLFLFLLESNDLFCRFDYLISSILTFCICTVWSFYWNNRFTFKGQVKHQKEILKAFIKTVISYSFTGLFLHNLLLYIFVEKCGILKTIVPLLNLVVTVPLNFILNKFWAFRSNEKSRSDSESAVNNNVLIHETSMVDDGVVIGDNTKIWHFCHIQSGAVIGESCTLGQNVNISNNVAIGNGVKIQNNVSVYEGVTIEDYVFCGPSCVFTNDLTPRSRYPKNHQYQTTIVCHDATIGANATIVCGHEIGHHATIAAGAVVVSDVPPHALMAGVPAKQIGWVCECGQVLEMEEVNSYHCPDCERRYYVESNTIQEKP